jgi:ABC-type phosphate transport system auxiliary subunit
VQLGTLGAVALSGITTFFQGVHIEDAGRKDRDKALSEIHQLYNQINDFEERQIKSLKNQESMMASNAELLRNQENVLRIMQGNQDRYLEGLLMKSQGP